MKVDSVRCLPVEVETTLAVASTAASDVCNCCQERKIHHQTREKSVQINVSVNACKKRDYLKNGVARIIDILKLCVT